MSKDNENLFNFIGQKLSLTPEPDDDEEDDSMSNPMMLMSSLQHWDFDRNDATRIICRAIFMKEDIREAMMQALKLPMIPAEMVTKFNEYLPMYKEMCVFMFPEEEHYWGILCE
jgi:hypothetical protein